MNNAILFAVIGLFVLMTSSLLLNISGRGVSTEQLFIYFFSKNVSMKAVTLFSFSQFCFYPRYLFNHIKYTLALNFL